MSKTNYGLLFEGENGDISFFVVGGRDFPYYSLGKLKEILTGPNAAAFLATLEQVIEHWCPLTKLHDIRSAAGANASSATAAVQLHVRITGKRLAVKYRTIAGGKVLVKKKSQQSSMCPMRNR